MDKKTLIKILNAAGDALFSIMGEEELADKLPARIQKKIDRWYKLTLKYQGKS